MHIRIKLVLLSLASSTSFLSITAKAADATAVSNPTTADLPAASSEGDIVVTGKTSRDMQRVPAPVSVLTPVDLANKNIGSIQGIQLTTPSLSIAPSGIATQVNLRGIGLTGSSPYIVNGVSILRDGTFQTQAGSFDPFFDMESVDVLRGPQGTDGGVNATAGTIVINSASARIGETGGYIQAQAGNYADHGAQGAYNFSLGKTLAARVAFNYEDRKSFYHNIGVGGEASTPGIFKAHGVRASIRWQPTPQLDVMLKAEATEKNGGGIAETPIPGRVSSAILASTGTDPFTLNYDTATQNLERNRRLTLDVRYELTPGGVRLRSLSSYNNLWIYNIYDLDASSVATTASPGRSQLLKDEWNIYQQRVTLESPDTGPFRWTIGGFYLDNDWYIDVYQKTRSSPTSAEMPSLTVGLQNHQQTVAGFGHATYQLTSALQLEAGLRYSHLRSVSDDRNATTIYGTCASTSRDSCTIAAYIPSPGRHSEHLLTGKLGLNWQVSPNHFLYAFYARGGKQGGVTGAGVNSGESNTFQPEKLNDFEVGVKSSFLGGALKTQLGGFWMDYRDFQLSTINASTGLSGIVNVTNAKVGGVEIGAQAEVGALRIDTNFAYIDSKLGEGALISGTPSGTLGPQCPAANIVTGTSTGCSLTGYFNYRPYETSFTGNRLPMSPKFTANLGASYRIDLAGGTLTPRIDISYSSSQWSSAVDNPGDLFAARTLVNARLGYDIDRYHVSLNAQNLTDKTYRVGQDGVNYIVGEPRTVFARINVEI